MQELEVPAPGRGLVGAAGVATQAESSGGFSSGNRGQGSCSRALYKKELESSVNCRLLREERRDKRCLEENRKTNASCRQDTAGRGEEGFQLQRELGCGGRC